MLPCVKTAALCSWATWLYIKNQLTLPHPFVQCLNKEVSRFLLQWIVHPSVTDPYHKSRRPSLWGHVALGITDFYIYYYTNNNHKKQGTSVTSVLAPVTVTTSWLFSCAQWGILTPPQSHQHYMLFLFFILLLRLYSTKPYLFDFPEL